MAYAGTLGQRRRQGSGLPGRLLWIALIVAGTGLTGAPIAYMVWPAPAAIAPDAPSLPITIGGIAFNIPPASIRFKVQRSPGAQPRIDLSFVWPSLQPPDLTIKPLPTDIPEVTDRLFVTIAVADSTLSPAERLKVIYPRYADAAAIVGSRRAQRAGVPRRLALSGRGLDAGAFGAGAFPASLHAPDRSDPGDVPA